MALIGYARVSTASKTPHYKRTLYARRVAKVFEDVVSGAKVDRPGLAAALGYLRDGDVLVVWRLDRLGRSLPHLIETVGALDARGVGFRSLTESIDYDFGRATHLSRVRRAGPVRTRFDTRTH